MSKTEKKTLLKGDNSCIGPELLLLSKVIERFNSRNVLEVVALLAGIKPVMRLVLDNSSRDVIESMLSQLGLHTVRSRWNLKESYNTTLGDVYTELTESDDSENSSFVIMVSQKRETAEKAMHFEDSEEENGALEKLLGYPTCCVKSYRNVNEAHDWLEELLVNTKHSDCYSWRANRISYLFSENSLFYDYFPCSLECGRTSEISRQILEAATSYGIRRECEKWRQEMCRPVLLRNGVVVQMREYSSHDRGGQLDFNPRKFTLHGWKVTPGADEDFVWVSDSVKRHGGKLQFLKEGKVTGAFPEETTDNRMLVFKEEL